MQETQSILQQLTSPEAFIYAFTFVLGLLVGSFLNVCISRLPREEPAEQSIVKPRSHCPKCKTPIAWYDNIPLLSYLLLGGKCRACKTKISVVYPIVELLTGLLFLTSASAFGLTLFAVKWIIFACLMIVLVFTDIIARTLPDQVTLVGLSVAFVFAIFLFLGDGAAETLSLRLFAFPPPAPVLSFVDALFGATFGGGLVWFVGVAYFKVRGRQGMGFGDVKMMAMIGAFLGLKRAFLTILFGSLLGSLLGSLVIITLFSRGWKIDVAERGFRQGLGSVRKLRWTLASRYWLPFGTYLGIAALIVVFWGTPLLDWYLRISGIR